MYTTCQSRFKTNETNVLKSHQRAWYSCVQKIINAAMEVKEIILDGLDHKLSWRKPTAYAGESWEHHI